MSEMSYEKCHGCDHAKEEYGLEKRPDGYKIWCIITGKTLEIIGCPKEKQSPTKIKG